MPTSKAERSDDALLFAIAGERDREAFAELYARYERQAFNLARCLTGDAGLAEEAVQEGMLRVWQSAGNFQAGGNARGWVLKIVAREGLRARGKAKRRDSMEIKDPLTEEAAGAAIVRRSGDATSDGELLDALRRHVARLPDVQRQIVALYYGGGLTQEEIAQEMDLQQRAVSRRLNEALEALRGQLTKAGLAAAVPMLGGDGLGAALTHGDAVPAGLRERVLTSVGKAGTRAARETTRAAAARGGAGAMPLVFAGMVLLAAGGLYVAMQGESPKDPPAAAARKTEATNVEAPKPGGLVDAAWDFSERMDNGLKPAPFYLDWYRSKVVPRKDAPWTWSAPSNDRPGQVFAEEMTTIVLPVGIGAKALEVTAELYAPPGGAGLFVDLAWLQSGEKPRAVARKPVWVRPSDNRTVRMEGDLKVNEGGLFSERMPKLKFVFVDREHALYIDGRLAEIMHQEAPAFPRRLAFTYQGAGLIKMRVRELKAEEIPEDLRDIPAFVKRLEPSEKPPARSAAKE